MKVIGAAYAPENAITVEDIAATTSCVANLIVISSSTVVLNSRRVDAHIDHRQYLCHKCNVLFWLEIF
jgi:hypothetical protein